MKKITLIFASLIFVVSLLSSIAFAQQTQTSEWIRVQSDDGEFSIDVPAKHDYFYDKDGFWVSLDRNSYNLQNMSMLNAYHENTLISLERYKGKKDGLEAIYENDKRFPKDIKTSSFNRNGTIIKQLTAKTDKYFYISQYFHSKSNIYILTVASRTGENATMKRFLESLIFKPDTVEKPDANSVLFSSLKTTMVDLFTAKKEDNEKKAETDKPSPEPIKTNNSKFTLVKRPSPAYVDVARMYQVQGTIQIKATFNENGFIPKIDVVKSLPEGLLRQAIFAALRIKFLPEEKEEKLISTTKTIIYSFSIY